MQDNDEYFLYSPEDMKRAGISLESSYITMRNIYHDNVRAIEKRDKENDMLKVRIGALREGENIAWNIAAFFFCVAMGLLALRLIGW